MGAELVRLAARDRIAVHNRAPAGGEYSWSPLTALPASFTGLRWVTVICPDPTGVTELDAHLRDLVAAGRPVELRNWIDTRRGGPRELRQVYLRRLEAAGGVRCGPGQMFGTRWYLGDPGPVSQAAARLDAIALGAGPVSLGQAALAGLASAMGLGKFRYGRGQGRQRLRHIEKGKETIAAGREGLVSAVAGIVDAVASVTRSSSP